MSPPPARGERPWLNLELKHSPNGHGKDLHPNDWPKDMRFLEGSKS
jgi:hypothetical protein